MFEAVEGIKFGYILCGIIWALALGFAAGNYACSLVHRLPRGRLILDKKPYCGSCGHELQVADLFPVVSALMLRHRCRYCHEPYPTSHTWTEILVGLLFVLAFLQYNFSEFFLMVVLIGIFLITLAAIQANENMIMNKIMVCILVFGVINRVLIDGTIYDFFNAGMVALVVSCFIWRKQIKPVAHIYLPPAPVMLITLGAICVGAKGLPLFVILFGLFYAVDFLLRKISRNPNPPLITVSFGFAAGLLVLYPKLALLLPL